jgi:hypothetical protein
MGSWIGTFVAAFGGAAVALAASVKWAARLGADLFIQRVKAASDQALEGFRAELAKQRELLATALSSRNTESLVAQERRLHAIEVLWENVLGLRTATAPALFPYSILVPSEYHLAWTGMMASAAVPSPAEVMQRISVSGASVEKVRPFLGEPLSISFFMYRGVLGRAAYRVAVAKESGKPLPMWQVGDDGKPEHLLSLARIVLTEEQIRSAVDRRFGGLQYLIDLMEQKILLEMDRRMSGAATAEITIAEGLRFADAIEQARSPIPTAPTRG